MALSSVDSVVDAIGKTPLVKLGRVLGAAGEGVTLFAKLEMQNPGGSVKDRIAKNMIEQAEKKGEISPDRTTVIEYTSGNTGIGVAMVCAAKGYKCVIVMPQLPAMKERYSICRKFGAEVRLTCGLKGVPGMKIYVEDLLAKEPEKYWCPRQFSNEDNPTVHFETTGPEIWEQAQGKVDYFISGVGTGGTVTGVGKFLKEKNPNVKVLAIEPTESRVMVGEPHTKHGIVGIGAGVPAVFIENMAPGEEWKEGPRGIIDEFVHCSTPECIQWADKLAKTEGLLVGPSTGAAMKIASEIASRPEAKGKTIVCIFPSSGIRYVNHPMWAGIVAEAATALPNPPNMDPEPLFRWNSSEPPAAA
jgi:cysteine synthase A